MVRLILIILMIATFALTACSPQIEPTTYPVREETSELPPAGERFPAEKIKQDTANNALATYFEVFASQDIETMKSIITEPEKLTESKKITKRMKNIYRVENINMKLVDFDENDNFIVAFGSFDMKYIGFEVGLPTFDTVTLEKVNGKWYVKNESTVESVTLENQVIIRDDYTEMRLDTERRYDEVVKVNKELQKFHESLYN